MTEADAYTKVGPLDGDLLDRVTHVPDPTPSVTPARIPFLADAQKRELPGLINDLARAARVRSRIPEIQESVDVLDWVADIMHEFNEQRLPETDVCLSVAAWVLYARPDLCRPGENGGWMQMLDRVERKLLEGWENMCSISYELGEGALKACREIETAGRGGITMGWAVSDLAVLALALSALHPLSFADEWSSLDQGDPYA